MPGHALEIKKERGRQGGEEERGHTESTRSVHVNPRGADRAPGQER
jgi:hypothetical protein